MMNFKNKYLWIPIFIGTTLVVLLFTFIFLLSSPAYAFGHCGNFGDCASCTAADRCGWANGSTCMASEFGQCPAGASTWAWTTSQCSSPITCTPPPTPAYTYPTPAYAYPTPAYAYPTPAYAYPTPAYAYPTPTYSYPTPAYAYPTPAYTYPTPTSSTPAPTPASTPTPTSPFSGGVKDELPGGGLIQNILGKIKPPAELAPFTKDKSGAGGLSLFLSNLIKLIYAVAGIVLVFMFVWGAFQWLTSGGDKEKIAAARARIIHAIIGLMLFAVAFAVIGALGTFTGFKFFEGQGGGSGCTTPSVACGECVAQTCSDGSQCATGHTYCVYDPGGNYCGPCKAEVDNCAVQCSGGTTAGWLNCSYSQPDTTGGCSSGFEICTGNTDYSACIGKTPDLCFNVRTQSGFDILCHYDASKGSTCTCSP